MRKIHLQLYRDRTLSDLLVDKELLVDERVTFSNLIAIDPKWGEYSPSIIPIDGEDILPYSYDGKVSVKWNLYSFEAPVIDYVDYYHLNDNVRCILWQGGIGDAGADIEIISKIFNWLIGTAVSGVIGNSVYAFLQNLVSSPNKCRKMIESTYKLTNERADAKSIALFLNSKECWDEETLLKILKFEDKDSLELFMAAFHYYKVSGQYYIFEEKQTS